MKRHFARLRSPDNWDVGRTKLDTRYPAATVGRCTSSGPNTRWLPADTIDFPIEKLAGCNTNHAGSPPVVNDLVFTSALGGSEERATPITRAQGQVIRLIPFSIIWLVLGIGLTWILGLAWPYLLLWFATLTALTYLRMNRDEFEYSRNGLERRRVDRAADLRQKELDQTHELKKMALLAYLDIARAHYLGTDHDTD